MGRDPVIWKMWHAVLDERTTFICATAHGQIRPVDEPFVLINGKFDSPPAHWNCRSTVDLYSRKQVRRRMGVGFGQPKLKSEARRSLLHTVKTFGVREFTSEEGMRLVAKAALVRAEKIAVRKAQATLVLKIAEPQIEAAKKELLRRIEAGDFDEFIMRVVGVLPGGDVVKQLPSATALVVDDFGFGEPLRIRWDSLMGQSNMRAVRRSAVYDVDDEAIRFWDESVGAAEAGGLIDDVGEYRINRILRDTAAQRDEANELVSYGMYVSRGNREPLTVIGGELTQRSVGVDSMNLEFLLNAARESGSLRPGEPVWIVRRRSRSILPVITDDDDFVDIGPASRLRTFVLPGVRWRIGDVRNAVVELSDGTEVHAVIVDLLDVTDELVGQLGRQSKPWLPVTSMARSFRETLGAQRIGGVGLLYEDGDVGAWLQYLKGREQPFASVVSMVSDSLDALAEKMKGSRAAIDLWMMRKWLRLYEGLDVDSPVSSEQFRGMIKARVARDVAAGMTDEELAESVRYLAWPSSVAAENRELANLALIDSVIRSGSGVDVARKWTEHVFEVVYTKLLDRYENAGVDLAYVANRLAEVVDQIVGGQVLVGEGLIARIQSAGRIAVKELVDEKKRVTLGDVVDAVEQRGVEVERFGGPVGILDRLIDWGIVDVDESVDRWAARGLEWRDLPVRAGVFQRTATLDERIEFVAKRAGVSESFVRTILEADVGEDDFPWWLYEFDQLSRLMAQHFVENRGQVWRRLSYLFGGDFATAASEFEAVLEDVHEAVVEATRRFADRDGLERIGQEVVNRMLRTYGGTINGSTGVVALQLAAWEHFGSGRRAATSWREFVMKVRSGEVEAPRDIAHLFTLPHVVEAAERVDGWRGSLNGVFRAMYDVFEGDRVEIARDVSPNGRMFLMRGLRYDVSQIEQMRREGRLVRAPELDDMTESLGIGRGGSSWYAYIAEVDMQPLNSFSPNVQWPLYFATVKRSENLISGIIAAEVPLEDVLGTHMTTFGAQPEWEVIVVGGQRKKVLLMLRREI